MPSLLDHRQFEQLSKSDYLGHALVVNQVVVQIYKDLMDYSAKRRELQEHCAMLRKEKKEGDYYSPVISEIQESMGELSSKIQELEDEVVRWEGLDRDDLLIWMSANRPKMGADGPDDSENSDSEGSDTSSNPNTTLAMEINNFRASRKPLGDNADVIGPVLRT